MVYVGYYWKETSMCVEGDGFCIVKCCSESNLRWGALLGSTGKLVGAKSASSTCLWFISMSRTVILLQM